MISPIREVYAGTEFRSTLEAEWARHLDHRGVRWQYEPQGLTLSDGTLYRPDFYLLDLDVWLEVKGPGVPRVEKAYQLAADGEWVVVGYPATYGYPDWDFVNPHSDHGQYDRLVALYSALGRSLGHLLRFDPTIPAGFWLEVEGPFAKWMGRP